MLPFLTALLSMITAFAPLIIEIHKRRKKDFKRLKRKKSRKQ